MWNLIKQIKDTPIKKIHLVNRLSRTQYSSKISLRMFGNVSQYLSSLYVHQSVPVNIFIRFSSFCNLKRINQYQSFSIEVQDVKCLSTTYKVLFIRILQTAKRIYYILDYISYQLKSIQSSL